MRFAFPLVGAVFVLIGLYMLFGRFLVDARARALTVYGVTNQRILILGGFRSRETKSLQLRTIPELTMTEREDGSGTIAFGPALPNAGYLPVLFSPSSGRMVSPSFEFIDRVRDVYETIRMAQQATSAAG